MLDPHPLSELFPMMDDSSYAELADSIRRNGLREPIILWEGKILDGRHRYRACLETGKDAITRHWEGPGDPLDFVLDANLHRRQLDDAQRTLVAAKISNLSRGRPSDKNPPNGGLSVSNKQAAALMKVSERGVERAKCILKKGAPELQAAVEARTVSIDAAADIAARLPIEEQRLVVNAGPRAVVQAAQAVRAGRPAVIKNDNVVHLQPPEPPKVNHGGTISVPEGSTVEAQVRKGMALEADGMPPAKVARELGTHEQNYRRIRDIITLIEEIDLKPADRQAAADALNAVNETRQMARANAMEPLVRRVWGSNSRNHHTVKTARKRVEHFATVTGLAVQSCANFDLEEFEIPYLLDEETRRWVKELESARKSLDAFIRKLKG